MTRSTLLLTVLLPLAACQPAAETDAQTARPGSDSSHAGMTGEADRAAHHGAMGHEMTGSSSYTDLAFLDGMTMHHQMAVEMAEPAEERAGSDEVRRLAEGIVRSQRAEIDSMRAWRARWFPDAPAAGPMSADDMASMGMAGMDMDGLTAARGPAFDRMFYEQMIPHHAGAITMAAQAQVESERTEIRDLAEGIISAQAREIGEMQAALEAGPSEPARPATPAATAAQPDGQ